jgi:hypothetical protein
MQKQFPLAKLVIVQLIKKFPTVYGNRRFITVYIRANHCSVFTVLRSSPRIRPISRSCATLCNTFSVCEKLLAPCQTRKPESHPLAAVRDYWRHFLLSASWERVMLWKILIYNYVLIDSQHLLKHQNQSRRHNLF